MHKKHLKRSFPNFSTRAYGPTNGRTDKASYRAACPQLKKIFQDKQNNLKVFQLIHH